MLVVSRASLRTCVVVALRREGASKRGVFRIAEKMLATRRDSGESYWDGTAMRRVESVPALRVIGFEASTHGNELRTNSLTSPPLVSSPLARLLSLPAEGGKGGDARDSLWGRSFSSGDSGNDTLSRSLSNENIMSTMSSTDSDQGNPEEDLELHMFTASTAIDIPYARGHRHFKR